MPFFSIVIPCYNAQRHIEATIHSVVEQEFDDWEMILIDDGSTDETPAILAAWALRDARIRAERLENGGPARARNHGALSKARGQIIAFLDADDLWAPARLRRLHAFFAISNAAALFNRVGFFRHSPEQLDAVSALPTGRLDAASFLAENPVCTMSNLAVRRSAFQRSGGFNETLVHNEDIEWLIRFLASGERLESLEGVLTLYRVSPEGLSANLESMREGWRAAAATAARLGVSPPPNRLTEVEAIHLRYLARRALRTGAPGTCALRLALEGLLLSPRGFFDVPHRGIATFLGSLAAPLLPRRLHASFFS